MNPIFKAINEGGKIRFINKEKFKEYVFTLPKDIEVIVRAFRNSRSAQQNRYYHAVVVKLISEHTGHSHDEVHDILKARSYVTKTCTTFKGKVYGIIKSTTSLNTKQMEEYLTDCRVWAWDELQVSIPLPNDVDF